MASKKQDPKELSEKVSNIQKLLNETGANLVVDGKYGPKTREALQGYFAPLMRKAIVSAEGNSKNYGVKVGESTDPNENYRTMSLSVDNNLDKFMRGESASDVYNNSQTPRFVDFMQERWAPYDAQNPAIKVTPKENELNPNWEGNVRKSLKRQLTPADYERLRRMRLAQLQTQMAVA